MIAIAVLCMLCYGRSKRFNLLQAANGNFSFAHNVSKRFVEIFHQIGMVLKANALAVKESLQEKAINKRVFISYDNMKFYEKARNQRLHNRAAFISYTAGYVCFMNTPGSSDNSDNNWYGRYLRPDQIDREAVNFFTNEDLVLDTVAICHCSVAVRYTISEVLSQYFSQATIKEKIMQGNGEFSHACAIEIAG